MARCTNLSLPKHHPDADIGQQSPDSRGPVAGQERTTVNSRIAPKILIRRWDVIRKRGQIYFLHL